MLNQSTLLRNEIMFFALVLDVQQKLSYTAKIET